MTRLESRCLGQVTKACSECRADDKNPKCPYYRSVPVGIIKVVDVQEPAQEDYSNQPAQPTVAYDWA